MPTNANSTAITCPTPAARLVARPYDVNIASSERKTRPPSIGNAGNMLNRTKPTLAQNSRIRNEPIIAAGVNTTPIVSIVLSTMNNTPAMATFTAGPASATANSWLGRSGMRSRLATPPIGNNVILRVPMWNRRAISA